MRIFYKILKKTGSLLLKLSGNLNNNNKSVKIRSGRERDLYKTNQNLLFWLDKEKYIDQCIINDGVFESKLTQIVSHLIKEGDIVLDIGANIGYYSVSFSKLVGKNGKVICFEPTQYYSRILKMNLEINGISNAEIIKYGLSNKKQELEIFIGNSTASLHNPGNLLNETKEGIKLTTLNDFIKDNPLQRIDLIKVDIDGHEPLFFEGAWNVLNKYDPIIVLEVSHLHYFNAGFTAWDFYKLLKERGYNIYHEDKLTKINSLEEFLIKCGNFAFSSNIIISKKDLKTG